LLRDFSRLAARKAQSAAFAAVCLLASMAAPLAAAAASGTWQNVGIGGGGFVTGLIIHPKERDVAYARTDVGGFFRWDAAGGRWLPLQDWMGDDQKNDYGGEAMAIDPNNADAVYIATGLYPSRPGKLYKSSDKGASWRLFSPPDWAVTMRGGGDKRWAGERLAVSPHDARIVLFGSRSDGLWRTEDDGASWTQIKIGAPAQDIGIVSVVFDPGRSGIAYAAVHGDGVYRSSDSGKTWQKLDYGPTQAMRLSVAGNGTLWTTHRSGVSVFDPNGALGNAWYWLDRTPLARATIYSGVAVNPLNASEIVVASAEGQASLYHSSDSGRTWQERAWAFNSAPVPWYAQLDSEQAWYRSWISALAFDPHRDGELWSSNWFQVARTADVRQSTVTWTPLVRNLEVVVNLDLIELRDGTLLTGHADTASFRHGNGLTDFPSEKLSRVGSQTNPWNYSMAFADSKLNPSRVLQVGFTLYGSDNSNSGLIRSDDGGRTWSQQMQWATQGNAGRPTKLALSPTNDGNIVVARESATAQYTTDGATWRDVTGLPPGPSVYQWGRPLAADGASAGTFYYYAADEAKVYRSTDGGASFAVAAANLPNNDRNNIKGNLKTPPGVAGEVWLGLGDNGLYRSRDRGATFSKVGAVERARVFGFGRAAAGKAEPALYLHGRVNGVDGIWMSEDSGATWANIQSDSVKVGAEPMTLEASPVQAGRVYIGTAGRGVYFFDAAKR
jgi:xyloglucan-specific exo-beta-1,4-glucanase